MARTLAATLGGAAGAVALVGIVGLLIWFCVFHKHGVSRTSETDTSDPSVQGRHLGVELSLREARRFELEELSLATKNFSDRNLIGEGKFGEVYKGLLQDEMPVAIKGELELLVRNLLMRQLPPPCPLPKGAGQVSPQKLEFKHRLSIALAAAKGDPLQNHPRLVHKDFKTANVLVDENFIAKVADAGLRNFLGRIDVAGPSSQVTADEIFLAPEVMEFRSFSEKSDAYSFGVYLLELVSGREASELPSSESTENLVEWVQNSQDYSNISSITDQRLGSGFTAECMEELKKLIVRCLEHSSERRPAKSYVVMELNRIVDKEMSLTTVMGVGNPTVTLGSQLFRVTK